MILTQNMTNPTHTAKVSIAAPSNEFLFVPKQTRKMDDDLETNCVTRQKISCLESTQ